MISGIAFRALAESFLARRPFPNQDSLLATLCSLRIGMSRGAAIRAERSWSTASGLSQTTTFAFEGSINRYYDPTTGQFMSVDPLVILTQAPYSYANGDPMNNTDPLGLWSLNPISDISEATSDVGEAVVSTVTNHWRGIVTGVGLVAGVFAAATGFGAIVEGSIALGLVSGGLGVVGGLADLPACIGTSGHHDGLACTGVAVGVGSGLLGGAGAFAGALVETGAVTANGVVDIYGGLSGAFGFAGGVGAVTFDGILGENGYLESCG
jgi:RHS repeat-associated protein